MVGNGPGVYRDRASLSEDDAGDQLNSLMQLTGWSLLDKLGADEANSEIQDIRVSQPAIFALQAGLASLWRSWGVKPAAVLGHSAGELAASYIAGALSLGDAVRLTFHRSRLLRRTARQGTMLAAGISREQALQLIKGHEHLVSVAAVNGPRSTTLSGDASILRRSTKSSTKPGCSAGLCKSMHRSTARK